MQLFVLLLIVVLCIDGSLASQLYESAKEEEGMARVDKEGETDRTSRMIEGSATTKPEVQPSEVEESSNALMSLRKLKQDLAVALSSIEDDSQEEPDKSAEEQVQEALTSSQTLSKLKNIRQALSTEVTETDREEEGQSVLLTTGPTSSGENVNTSETPASQELHKQGNGSPKGSPLIRSQSVTLPRTMKVPGLHTSDEEISIPPKRSSPTLKPSETFQVLPSLLDLGKPADSRILRVVPTKSNKRASNAKDGRDESEVEVMPTLYTIYKPKVDPSLFKKPDEQEQLHYIKRHVVPGGSTTSGRNKLRISTGQSVPLEGNATKRAKGKDNGLTKPRKCQTPFTPKNPSSSSSAKDDSPSSFVEVIPESTSTTETTNIGVMSLESETAPELPACPTTLATMESSSCSSSSCSSSSCSSSSTSVTSTSLLSESTLNIPTSHQPPSPLNSSLTLQPSSDLSTRREGSLGSQQVSVGTTNPQGEPLVSSLQTDRGVQTASGDSTLNQGQPPNPAVRRQVERSSYWSDCTIFPSCMSSRERQG